MIGLDTNVIVRYLVQDDPDQAERAHQTMDALGPDRRGFVTRIVLVETFWVLTRSYQLARDEVLRTLLALVERDEIAAEEHARTVAALRAACDGADLADALIVETCRAAGVDEIVTFDRGAASRGMTLI